MCQEWHPLRCPCPSDCDDVTVRDWSHATCGGTMYINSDAYIKCMEHSNPVLITNYKLACINHQHENKAVCKDSMVLSLTIMAGNLQAAGNSVWAKKLLITMRDVLFRET